MVDIKQYKPTFQPRTTIPYPAELALDTLGDWEKLEEVLPDPDLAIQEALSTPARQPRGTILHPGPAVHVLFDGGSNRGLGTAGYVILDCEG